MCVGVVEDGAERERESERERKRARERESGYVAGHGASFDLTINFDGQTGGVDGGAGAGAVRER